ncbi:hypothetical protein SAMN05444414_102211 [Roseovarius marisflavi]|uniref:DUF5681 domain-containing protein n=1 Tax=Roseovarius marisflavi TaxID=1054996 RepID=A0A1M6WA95_9RHOB|nr:hypothetical protein SAMN05444414_102211 [Roseovarius marisflavi]
MARASKHGGKRAGAGRPKGSRSRRSEAVAEKLLSQGKCPVEALVRLAEEAEADGDRSQAINAWKTILPFVHPKPKAVEIDPEAVVALARLLSEEKIRATEGVDDAPWGQMLERMRKSLEADGNLA